MELQIIEENGRKIAEVIVDEIVVNDTQNALDLMADAGYYGVRNIILYDKNLNPDFFNLRTQLAGDILLKFASYHVKLAIVGNFEKYSSGSLQAFIRESNQGNQVFFVPDRASAITRLSE